MRHLAKVFWRRLSASTSLGEGLLEEALCKYVTWRRSCLPGVWLTYWRRRPCGEGLDQVGYLAEVFSRRLSASTSLGGGLLKEALYKYVTWRRSS